MPNRNPSAPAMHLQLSAGGRWVGALLNYSCREKGHRTRPGLPLAGWEAGRGYRRPLFGRKLLCRVGTSLLSGRKLLCKSRTLR